MADATSDSSSRRIGLEGPTRTPFAGILVPHLSCAEVSPAAARASPLPSHTAQLRTGHRRVSGLRLLDLPQEELEPELVGRQFASAGALGRAACLSAPAQVLTQQEFQQRLIKVDLAEAGPRQLPHAEPDLPDAEAGHQELGLAAVPSGLGQTTEARIPVRLPDCALRPPGTTGQHDRARSHTPRFRDGRLDNGRTSANACWGMPDFPDIVAPYGALREPPRSGLPPWWPAPRQAARHPPGPSTSTSQRRMRRTPYRTPAQGTAQRR